MKPSPPKNLLSVIHQIFNTLPDMMTIAKTCKSDADIVKNFGQETLEFLRWIILSNKSQLIHLPPQLRLKEVPFKTQFMSLIASPEKESFFQKKKKKKKNIKKKKKKKKKYFKKKKKKNKEKKKPKHQKQQDNLKGLSVFRWHSIFRNGLKNMTNIDCVNGDAHGPGIYLAADAEMSLVYTHTVQNLYMNSMFDDEFILIALCEVVPNKYYKNFGCFSTLQDNDAIIVRFVFPMN